MGFWSRRTKTSAESSSEEVLTQYELAEEADSISERFCGGDFLSFPAGAGRYLLYSVADGSMQYISEELAVLLSQCRTFKTLKEHAAASSPVFELSARGMKGAYMKSVRQQFTHLIERGLLVSERGLVDQCRQAPERTPPPPLSTIAVVTADRPESLRRCLQSYADNANAHGRSVEFIVADDSSSASGRRQTSELLRELARNSISVRYAGADEKRRYADALLHGGDFPPDLIEFALFDAERYQYTPGANRNALLLSLGGQTFFSTDDDIVCRVAVAPDAEEDSDEDARDTNQYEPINLWLYPDRETAVQAANFVDEDVLAPHDELLGRTVAGTVINRGDAGLLNLERVTPQDLRSITSGLAMVTLTLNGCVGHSGARLPAVFRPLNRQSRARSIADESHYLNSRFSREVLRLVDRPSISRRLSFMTYAVGYDNRQLLPPFMPVARGEDGVFVEALKTCFDDFFLADLPRAVLHMPPEPRHYTPGEVWDAAANLLLGYIVAACVGSFRPWFGMTGAAAKLRALGQHLVDVASMSLPDFEDFVRIHVWQRQSVYIAELEGELMDFADAPAFWLKDLDQYLGTMREAFQNPDYIIPCDLPPGLSRDEARETTRRLVSKYGELLRAWPDIVEKANELHAKERSLTAVI